MQAPAHPAGVFSCRWGRASNRRALLWYSACDAAAFEPLLPAGACPATFQSTSASHPACRRAPDAV